MFVQTTNRYFDFHHIAPAARQIGDAILYFWPPLEPTGINV